MMKVPQSGTQSHIHWTLGRDKALTRALLETTPVLYSTFLSLEPAIPSLHRKKLRPSE